MYLFPQTIVTTHILQVHSIFIFTCATLQLKGMNALFGIYNLPEKKNTEVFLTFPDSISKKFQLKSSLLTVDCSHLAAIKTPLPENTCQTFFLSIHRIFPSLQKKVYFFKYIFTCFFFIIIIPSIYLSLTYIPLPLLRTFCHCS